MKQHEEIIYMRVSDWSRDLTRAQMKCTYSVKGRMNKATISLTVDASNDAHSGLMVYKELIGRGDGELVNRTSHGGGVLTPSPGGDGPPHRQAYTLWRQGHGLLDICIRMRDRTNPQSETVVMCVCISSLWKKACSLNVKS